MADVSKIKLPDNSTVNIKDYRIPGVDSSPTSSSNNLVTSGGVYKDIEDISLVTSASINDLNDRLVDIEENGIPAIHITNVTVGGTSVVSNGVAAIPAIPELAVSKTYSELKSLRDGSNLVPNTLYRITDYTTTTVDTESRSIGHAFDILVRAIDASHLSEEAGACLHDGDTYFANTNFDAWKIWYCLDNDTTRFTWADTTNGKGIIYRMIDEWNNDVPYDFKNIQFKRYKVTAQSTYTDVLSTLNGLYIGLPSNFSKGLDIDTSDYKWYYTFSRLGSTWADDVTDDSILGTYATDATFTHPYSKNVWDLNNIVCANGECLQSFLSSLGDRIDTDLPSCSNSHFSIDSSRLSLFGCSANNFGESQFRNNIFIGEFRHCQFGSDFEKNTFVCVKNNAFNSYAPGFSNNIIVSTGVYYGNRWGQNSLNNVFKSSAQIYYNDFGNYFQSNTFTITGNTNFNIFFESFSNNTIYGIINGVTFTGSCNNNTFGTQQAPVNFSQTKANRITNCSLTGVITQTVFNGQITYCEFNGPIAAGVFDAILQYVVVPTGANASDYFASVDLKGFICGTSSAKITLNAPQFRLSELSGVSRRIRIEGDTDGNIIATWKGTGGKEVGIKSTDNGATWTALESIAYASDIIDVEANPTVPSGTTPTTLTGMKVGSNYYSVSSGGGGGGNYAGSPSNGGPANKTLAIPFGKLDSTSTSTVMTATVDNFPTTLSDGVCAYIKNGVVTSESGFTLNINNTGALPVYSTQADATRITTTFNINYTFLFVYNSSRVEGGCWDMYYGYTNSTANTLRTNQVSRTATAKTYRYRLLFSSADDTQWVPANTSTSTNATAARSANQTPINPWGDIRYYSATTAVNADSSFSASYLYEQNGVTLGYSFNTTGAALTLTEKAPVYIKCAPQSNGSAIIDSTTPYTQALPTTEDGKIYIFLGVAYSATALELVPYHPVYHYKDGAIRIWTNELSNDTKVLTTNPAGGFVPNVMYNLGTLTGSITFTLASPADNTIVNHYYWTFTADSTAPTITWPSGVSWFGGAAPVITAGKYYEISVLNNVVVYMEV